MCKYTGLQCNESPAVTDFMKSDDQGKESADPTQRLPDYAEGLDRFHQAFFEELRAVIARLPLAAGMKILDIGCGDGFYTRMLAERLSSVNDSASGRGGEVVGIDNNPDFLAVARRRCESAAATSPRISPCRFVQNDLDRLAGEGPTYDLVWCAQSLYSFPEPVAALKRIAAVLKPGGRVIVLENDTNHQLLLPWPMESELIIRAAEFAALTAESKRPSKFYVGRRLPAVLAESGLEDVAAQTQAIDRAAPLDSPLAAFLQSYLERLAERITPHLDPCHIAAVLDLLSPESDRYLLRRPHFMCTWINVIACGRKPGTASEPRAT